MLVLTSQLPSQLADVLPWLRTCASYWIAGGVGAEDEAVLLVLVGVEDDLERIHVAEARVAARVGRDDLRRIGVVHHRADINRLVVVDDADFGGFGRGLPFERLGLDEVGERGRGLPDAIVQHAVDRRRFRRRHRGGDRPGVLRQRRRGTGEEQKNNRSYIHFEIPGRGQRPAARMTVEFIVLRPLNGSAVPGSQIAPVVTSAAI